MDFFDIVKKLFEALLWIVSVLLIAIMMLAPDMARAEGQIKYYKDGIAQHQNGTYRVKKDKSIVRVNPIGIPQYREGVYRKQKDGSYVRYNDIGIPQHKEGSYRFERKP